MMNKLYVKVLAVFMAVTLLNVQAHAGTFIETDVATDVSEISNFDEAEIYSEFEEIEELTSLLLTTDLSASEILDASPELLINVQDDASLPESGSSSSNDAPLGIPSFLWGCIFGLLGILLVYIVTEDNDQAKKAVGGCAVGSLITIVIYVALIATAETTTSSTY